jgi:hypothetical protein
VVQAALVAQRDLAGSPDAVPALAVVASGEHWALGEGLGPGGVGLGRGAPVEGTVWAYVVVIGTEPVEEELERGQAIGTALFG